MLIIPPWFNVAKSD